MSETVLHQHKWIDVVKYRWVWFGLSLLLVIPGLIAMGYLMINSPQHLPVKVGIDYRRYNHTILCNQRRI